MASPIHKTIPGLHAPAIEVGSPYPVTLTNNVSNYTIYNVTEGRKFKPATIIVTNQSANATVTIFDSSSSLSNRIIQLIIGAEKTEILGPEDLIGIKEAISSIEVGSTISGVVVHIGGFEY